MKSNRKVFGSLAIAVSSVFLLSACQSVDVTQEGAVLTAAATEDKQIIWAVYSDEFVSSYGPAEALNSAFLQDWLESDPTVVAYGEGEFHCDDEELNSTRTEFCDELLAWETALFEAFGGGKLAFAEIDTPGNELDLEITGFNSIGGGLPEDWTGCGYYVQAFALNAGELDIFNTVDAGGDAGGLVGNLQVFQDFYTAFETNRTSFDFTCKDQVGPPENGGGGPPTTTPTPTPTPTTTPTPTPTPTTTPTPTPPLLAKTGAAVGWFALGSLGAVLVGSVFSVLSRGRRFS